MKIDLSIEVIKHKKINIELELHEAIIILKAMKNIDLCKTPRDMDYELEEFTKQLSKAIDKSEIE
jgi:hypothetical protein